MCEEDVAICRLLSTKVLLPSTTLSYHYAELPATRAKRVKKAESATDG
jgi:hypothetical protein